MSRIVTKIEGWAGQELRTVQPLELVRLGREKLAADGRLVREECDHNSVRYNGISNKRITIFATAMLGRPPLDFNEAWAIYMEVLVGR